MQKNVGLLSLFLLFLPLLAKIWVIGDYALYKTYYATVVCEQKAVPSNCCEGRCYLDKQLRRIEQPAQQQESDQPIVVPSYKFDYYTIPNPINCCTWLAVNSLGLKSHQTAIQQFMYQDALSHLLGLSVFHPPKAAVLLY